MLKLDSVSIKITDRKEKEESIKMTKYDFTTIPNRLEHNSVKWQEIKENPHKLPLWVADMDFLALPCQKLNKASMITLITVFMAMLMWKIA